MKSYRVEFSGGFSTLAYLLVITVLCLTVVGLPLGIALFPTLYRLIEEEK